MRSGWYKESHRHSLAARGVKTNRYYSNKYYAYNPTYVSGDLPAIGADAAGTAGAEAVSWLPVVVPFALAYGVAKVAKKHKDKTGHWYLAEKNVSQENREFMHGLVAKDREFAIGMVMETEGLSRDQAEKYINKVLDEEDHHMRKYNASKYEESLESFSQRTGFKPYNPLDPESTIEKPKDFITMSPEDQDRYIEESEKSLAAAEGFVKNIEELYVHHPEFVKKHYGEIADKYQNYEDRKAMERQVAARTAFIKAVPEVPYVETRAPTEEQLKAEIPEPQELVNARNELARLQAEESLRSI